MMQLPFADADNEIEHDAGMKIPEYFERYGEPEFRKLESDVVLDMLEISTASSPWAGALQ